MAEHNVDRAFSDAAVSGFPLRGIGIGWRPEIAGLIADLPGLAFCEIVAESVAHVPSAPLLDLGVPIIPHGIGLSLGGAEPVVVERISMLADAATRLRSPMVSEHIAFVRAGDLDAGHILPIPRSREALDAVVANIMRTQDGLPVPLAVENIASTFFWPDDEYTDGEFLAEIIERTGVFLLLDVANVYACAANRGLDPARELALLPTDRIAYCHVAGGEVRSGDVNSGDVNSGEPGPTVYHDTHREPVPPEVLGLVTQLAGTGHAPAFMLERDGNYPPAQELLTELDAIADAAGMDRITVGSRWWEVA